MSAVRGRRGAAAALLAALAVVASPVPAHGQPAAEQCTERVEQRLGDSGLRSSTTVCTERLAVQGLPTLRVRTDVVLSAAAAVPASPFASFTVISRLAPAQGDSAERRCDVSGALSGAGWSRRTVSCLLEVSVSAGTFTPSGNATFELAPRAGEPAPGEDLPGQVTAAGADGGAGSDAGPAVEGVADSMPVWLGAAAVVALLVAAVDRTAQRRRTST